MSFQAKYNSVLNIVKPDIDIIEKKIIQDIKIPSPINLSLKEFLLNNPKRIRPLTAFLFLRASGQDVIEKQYDFQTAVELIHNASLIHDDVVDESDLRRGNETLNKKFNNKLAILSGDYLLSIALKKLNRLDCPEIIDMCAETLEGMCIGEVNQYNNKFKIPTIEEYIEKSRQKTAKLFYTAVFGADIIAGGKNKKIAQDFSLAFGTAFQIRDDLLNITDNNSLKPSNSDIESGIYNAPVILGGGISNLETGIEKTKILLNNYIDECLNTLQNFEESKYKKGLIELLEIFKNE